MVKKGFQMSNEKWMCTNQNVLT